MSTKESPWGIVECGILGKIIKLTINKNYEKI